MVKFNLYIKGLPKEATEEELMAYFAAFGEVKNVRIMRKKVDKEQTQ